MAKDLKSIARRKAIELKHDRRIERSDVAMPDVVRNAREKNVGVAAFERLRHRQFWNRMPLPEIFAQKEPVDSRCVAAHDHVLIVVRENLSLNKVAWAQ